MKVETTATTMKPYLQYRIGRMFYDGYRTKTDMETALKWLEQAASGSMDAAKAEAQSRHPCRLWASALATTTRSIRSAKCTVTVQAQLRTWKKQSST